jgi:hypothetical protein
LVLAYQLAGYRKNLAALIESQKILPITTPKEMKEVIKSLFILFYFIFNQQSECTFYKLKL